MTPAPPLPVERLRLAFEGRIRFDAPLDRHTAARIGGPADALLTVESADALRRAAEFFWAEGVPFILLGAGSNVLVSDRGVRGVVVLNKARAVQFDDRSDPPTVRAESGANFGALARAAASRGLSGLEWAAGVPGSVGGAVVGNAGAHGGDMAGNLLWADLLERGVGVRRRPVAEMGYVYRGSVLKGGALEAVVLEAGLRLAHGAPDEIEARLESFLAHRRRTQPPGASMGSMFKNPPGDFAGRMIDQAGLKGARIGEAQISPLHGNFFLNMGAARAADVRALIETARRAVAERFGVELELEVELLGDWDSDEERSHG